VSKHTLFISDLHLSADRPDITQCLHRFLHKEAVKANALYVLGDLFEYWIGDDDRNSFTDDIVNAFHALANKDVPIYFIHGNRDFLIRDGFTKRAGMKLLPEQQVIDLYGSPTLLMHGDELCTKDIAYQRFRKKARSWWWPALMLRLPLNLRRNLAMKARKKSDKNKTMLSADIMDVTPSEVLKWMKQTGVTMMIHGHTHRPAIHNLTLYGKPCKRIVLGDWYEQGSVLRVTEEGEHILRSLSFS
jgi:UDP-2,3-diacylglucosamine hydrolase